MDDHQRDPDPGMPARLQAPIASNVRKAQVRAALFRTSEPIRIGRFILLEPLGAGAMGEIYAAYDEQLDRKVALKLVRGGSPLTAKADERLLREAQTLAQVSHPNVVQVYEAGTYSGRLFIAMELIRGKTLSSWLKDVAQVPRPLRQREILRSFIAAGRGLEAAHAAGVAQVRAAGGTVTDLAGAGGSRLEVMSMPERFGPNLHHVGPATRNPAGDAFDVRSVHGRKFGRGSGPATEHRQRVEAIPAGTVLAGQLRLFNVTPAELGGVLAALGYDPRSALKLGGGKSHGFGRVYCQLAGHGAPAACHCFTFAENSSCGIGTGVRPSPGFHPHITILSSVKCSTS